MSHGTFGWTQGLERTITSAFSGSPQQDDDTFFKHWAQTLISTLNSAMQLKDRVDEKTTQDSCWAVITELDELIIALDKDGKILRRQGKDGVGVLSDDELAPLYTKILEKIYALSDCKNAAEVRHLLEVLPSNIRNLHPRDNESPATIFKTLLNVGAPALEPGQTLAR